MTLALPPKPQSLREYVEAYLKQAIVGGKYKPGDRLIEREICELLGVSRPPVREALRQLEADKLITHELHRGPVIASVSCEEASELYAFRALLESFAVAEFSRLASDAQIKELGLAIKKLNEAAKKVDKQPLLEAKSLVYKIILDGCGNQLVSESLNKLLDRVNILRGTSLLQPDRFSSLPTVPTFSQSGIPGFQLSVWHGPYAPKDTPKPVIDRFAKALNIALKDPVLVSRFTEMDAAVAIPAMANPAALSKFLAADIERWKTAMKNAGVKPQ